MLFVTMDGPKQSSADLARGIVDEARELVRLEVRLAQQELRELAIRNAIAIGLLAFGALLLLVAVLVAVPTFLVLLWWNHVAGAAIWLGAYVVLAAALLLAGRLALRLRVPPRTLASLEETKRWALRQIRSNGR